MYALSTEDKKWQSCALLRPMNSNAGMLRYEVKFLSRDGNRIELGIRKKYSALGPGFRLENIEDLPEEKYWFEPGETLPVNVAGFGTMAVTGEWMDHMPSLIADNHDLDPRPEEFRMISPLLLRGKEVVGEFEGAIHGYRRYDEPGHLGVLAGARTLRTVLVAVGRCCSGQRLAEPNLLRDRRRVVYFLDRGADRSKRTDLDPARC